MEATDYIFVGYVITHFVTIYDKCTNFLGIVMLHENLLENHIRFNKNIFLFSLCIFLFEKSCIYI